MHMSISSIKKISAAAVAAVLGFSAVSHAATIYSDPTTPVSGTYSNIDPPGTPGSTFTGGTLAMPGDGTPGSADYSDYVPTAGDGTTLVPTAPPGASGGQVLTISFSMNTTIAGSSAADPAVGVEAIDSNGNITASLFSQYGPDGLPDLLVSDGSNNTINVPGFATDASGSTGTYTLTLDPTNNTYFVQYGGQTFAGELWSANTPDLTIAGVSLAGIDQGIAGSASFGNFSVVTSVPEPASIAMIGLGGLMLLAKRPKRLA
jgi:hypothetical protein